MGQAGHIVQSRGAAAFLLSFVMRSPSFLSDTALFAITEFIRDLVVEKLKGLMLHSICQITHGWLLSQDSAPYCSAHETGEVLMRQGRKI